MDRHGLSDNFSGHSAFYFDVLGANRPKTVNVSLALDDYVPAADATGDLP
jgi:hypothetical protein